MYVVLEVILALLVIFFVSIAKVYHSIPLTELKRRARAGEQPAKSLYVVASYEYSSQIFLYLLAAIASTFFFVYVARKSPLWVALVVDLALIWLAYVWIPRSSIGIVSEYLAQVVARPLGWILQYIHPPLKHARKAMPKSSHTGLYEKSDIVKLLDVQQKQTDNRINEFEIDLLKHALNFGDKQVLDIMTPRRKVKAISVNETLGPIVLSELHKTKHTYFPVYGDKTTDIVGILSIAALTNSRITLKVNEIMSQSLHYVHEEQYLDEALQVIIKSSQEVLVVINSDQEYVGIITAREILKNLVGDVITEEFDNYDNRELVANRFTPPEPSLEITPPEDELDKPNQETSA